MKKKEYSTKAQSMSINTVVIAALALIVLIILVLIMSGRIKKTSEGIDKTSEIVDTSKCEIPGVRSCVLYEECETQELYSMPGCNPGTYCCELPDIKR